MANGAYNYTNISWSIMNILHTTTELGQHIFVLCRIFAGWSLLIDRNLQTQGSYRIHVSVHIRMASLGSYKGESEEEKITRKHIDSHAQDWI